ncbi:MAG: nucleotide exchange factor GrpE [Roseburia sp.]|nr:nucleotide exchange factor GrpE [Roseburia sp.]MCM1097887.1 nucleotide exchange factor GrpE [Ruminococcus flavefaciens]
MEEQERKAAQEEAEEKPDRESKAAQEAGEKPGTDGETAETAGTEEAAEPGKASEDGKEFVGEEAAETEGEEASEETPPEGEDPKTWAERRAAKKQAKLDKKTDALKDQIAQLEDKVKRQLAEFENFRNRTEKEKSAMFETGAKSVIEKMLPVVDNFERGLATVSEEKKDDAFVEGMNRIYKQLMTELENIGVKPIEAEGKEFDPNLHNAVMQVEDGDYESGTVVQELQKGYTYRDSVVRHSMVSVKM